MSETLSPVSMERVSIVLPVGPGDRSWPPLHAALCSHAPQAELLPVFATGDPQTAPAGALRCAPGRARQQNAGAEAATRDWLWFVHADTRLTPEALPALGTFLARDEPALGWFRLRFAEEGPRALRLRMRCNAVGANWRSRALGLPFGDQGLVLPRAAFARLGGFDTTLACGEDHALVWAARRAGLPLRAIDAALITSARKYAERGWAATTLRHLRLTAVQAWREARR
jgi:GT2 family glycosyltransferase